MAKQGQHKNDAHDQRQTKGPNNPSRSEPITAGRGGSASNRGAGPRGD